MTISVSDKGLRSTDLDWQEYLSTRSAKSRNLLVAHYFESLSLPTARRFARKAAYSGCIDEEDMAQESVFVLIRAVEEYDPNHPRIASFETFAMPRVAGSMKSYLRDLDEVPRLNRLRSKAYEKGVRELMAERGGELPSENSIRLKMRMSKKEYADAERAGDLRLIEIERSPINLQTPYIESMIADLRIRLSEGLSEKEKRFLDLHFFRGMRIRELPGLFGVKTTGAVAHVKRAVIERIKGKFDSEESRRHLEFLLAG